MIATVENMRRCEAAGIRAVVLDPETGVTFSATPGDYFWLGDEPLTSTDNGEPFVLVRVVPKHYEPIGEAEL